MYVDIWCCSRAIIGAAWVIKETIVRVTRRAVGTKKVSPVLAVLPVQIPVFNRQRGALQRKMTVTCVSSGGSVCVCV